MNARAFLRRFGSDQRGAAAEFALVLVPALLVLLGVVDAGRYLYEVNRMEKATQVGARFAVVTDPVLQELTSYSFVGVTVEGSPLSQGDRIPASALGHVTCDDNSCDCTAGTCLGGTLTWAATPHANLLARVQLFAPQVAAANLRVEYRGSGLGYAGDPNGMDVSPLTTVRLTGVEFTPAVLFGSTTFDLPDSTYSLTMEDASGTGSN